MTTKMIKIGNVVGFLFIFITSGINARGLDTKAGEPDFSESYGKYKISITFNPFGFRLTNEETNQVLLRTRGDLILKHLLNTDMVYKKPYTVFSEGLVVDKIVLTRITKSSVTDGYHYFYLGDAENDAVAFIKCRLMEDLTLVFEINEMAPASRDISRISQFSISFDSDSTDSYMGMGMRYNTVNHYGTVVTTWADEVGVNLPLVARSASAQGRDITYAPVPFYLNLKGYGMWLRTFNYAVFDFASTDKKALTITNSAGHLNFAIYLSDKPLDIVGHYMKSNGQFMLPKPWVFGVWAAAGTDYQSGKKGQQVNHEVLDNCRKNKIPLSGIMAEDWYFDFLSLSPNEDWTVNHKYYPDYAKMIADQHKSGVKHIGYFLPYLGQKKLFRPNKSFVEADSMGLMTKNKFKQTFSFKFAVWDAAQFDWTNPDAVNYFHRKFYTYAASRGVDGWMNDFGEYTPYTSLSFNGEWGSTMHNLYPLLWANTAKEFFRNLRPDNDFCLFSRSGAAGLHQYNAFIFTGDRNATYEPLSGMGGQITGVLNAGLSVHPNVSVDIGAYNCEKVKPMNKLMMFRWIELGALIPVMRLHRGLQLCNHWRFDEDEETLLHWKKYAGLHAKLFPYIYTLARQAVDMGWPLVRNLALYYPTDVVCIQQQYEFLLGDRILSCPVVDEASNTARSDMTKARQTWRVYLPEGNWYHYWTDRKYKGGAYYVVPASPGFLPMFIKEGMILPTYNKEVDTFVEDVEDPLIKDFAYVNDSIEVLFYGYGSDEFTLWDGTTIKCSRHIGEKGSFEVLNGSGRGYGVIFID